MGSDRPREREEEGEGGRRGLAELMVDVGAYSASPFGELCLLRSEAWRADAVRRSRRGEASMKRPRRSPFKSATQAHPIANGPQSPLQISTWTDAYGLVSNQICAGGRTC